MTIELALKDIQDRLPGRPREGHKGTFGHVFVVAGSRGFSGAVRLAGLGALRSGAGLVTVGIPAPLGDLVGASAPAELMTRLLPATADEALCGEAVEPALAFAEDKDAVVLGPGISRHPATREFVAEFTRRCPVPLLVDADGLNCLSKDLDALKPPHGGRVLTPHPGEMGRLTGRSAGDVQRDREGVARRFVAEYGCVLVLKGHRTLVASPDGGCLVNPTGNSGLGTGGTGDVLSGIIGGLLGQGASPVDAAAAGVYVHGLAGDIAADRFTERGMVASDVIECLPEAWRRIEGAGRR